MDVLFLHTAGLGLIGGGRLPGRAAVGAEIDGTKQLSAGARQNSVSKNVSACLPTCTSVVSVQLACHPVIEHKKRLLP